jgi:hypothetical protein
LNPHIYSQSTFVKPTEKGFNLLLDIPQFKYREIKKGNYSQKDYFEFTDEASPGTLKLPKISILLAIPSESKPEIVIINKDSHIEKFTLPTLNPITYLDENGILKYEEVDFQHYSHQNKQDIVDIEGYFYLRGIYCMALTINPLNYDSKTNSLEVIDRLEIEINFDKKQLNMINYEKNNFSAYDEVLSNFILNKDMIPQFYSARGIIPDSLFNWIDFNATYVKLGTAEDGIYRIHKSDLENYGINTTLINPQTFRFILKGKEIPIYVYGESDNTFDDSDFIEFYGSKNYADGDYRIVNGHDEPYSEYIDRYSDTTIYWLTWGGITGARIDTSNYIILGIQDTINQYTNIIHYEQNNFLDYFTNSVVTWQNPEWIYNESWIWGQQGVGTVDNPFNISDLVQDDNAKAFWRVQSYASDLPGIEKAHNLGLSINNNPTIYDSGYIDKYEQKVLVAEFPSNVLQSGQNYLKTHSFPVDNANINSLQVDWYEVEYPRYLSLINETLKFKFNQSLSSSLKVIKLTNALPSNYILYKIKGGDRRVNNFIKIGSELFFADTLKTSDEYFITTENNILSPKIYYKKQFQNLVDPNTQADYILISHPYFDSAVSSYSDYIENNYPLNVKYVNVLDIYDQFNYGFFSPETIKEFLIQANQYWLNPKPSYLFLIGEANYDYHNYKQITPYVHNIVPSFGHPVSDSWFAIWDSVSFLPQMFVGRLPAANETEVIHYLNKHQKYLNDRYNIWNKSYSLLSGGLTESEKLIGKNINDNLRLNFIQTAPTGGYVGQLYATENPRTNFGPFTQEYIDSVFDNGGIVVSYVGHSGTKTWDNGIEDVEDLKNKYDKYPLINDFGCSTAKFAEFDITSFSEKFVNGLDGDAIAYQGNSSLGFTSTSYTFPQLYFENLLLEKKYNVGLAHVSAKIKLLNDYGYSESNKLFILCNTLIGDPVINLKIPAKVNLEISEEDIKIPAFLDDNLDSIIVQIDYRNLGLVENLQYDIKIEDRLNNQLVFENTLRQNIPLNDFSFKIGIPVKNKSGEHNLQIILDALNEVDELFEDDNQVSVRFVVLTTSVRAVVADSQKIIDNGMIIFLNSVKKPANDTILIRLSNNPNFIGESTYKIKFDSLRTLFTFTNLMNENRYWYKTSFTTSPDAIFEKNSFVYSDSTSYNFAFSDSISVGEFQFENMGVKDGIIRLNDRLIPLIISSAGFEPGGTAKISLDDIDYVVNAQGCGHHIVVIDEATLQFEDYRWFNNWNDPNNYPAYYNYLSSIPEGKLVAISIGGECGGFNINDSLKTILNNFGSVYIDSVMWGSSWILLGEKNAPQGSVPESFSKTGPVEFDTTFVGKTLAGWFETSKINNSNYWKKLIINVDSIDNYNQIKLRPIVHQPIPDSLDEIILNEQNIDLSELNSHDISALSFNFSLVANNDGTSPLINAVKIEYDLVTELATNYQVVYNKKDSVKIVEDI